MRIKLNFYLLLSLFLLTNPYDYCLAQTPDNYIPEVKKFGESLNKNKKKDKDIDKNIVQINSPADDEDVIRVETSLILNEILVFDPKGQPVRGLKKEDFVVREDEAQQEISTFSLGNSEAFPRSIVLIIDYSGSQLPYINTSVDAAKVLVDKLNEKDRMAIVTDDVELLQGFTQNKTLLKEKLELLKTSAMVGNLGRSRQISALMAVLNEMFNNETLRPIIIFQTDGDQLTELKGRKENNSPQKASGFTYSDILVSLEKTRATVYTIIPGPQLVGIPEAEKLRKVKDYLTKNELIFAEVNKRQIDSEKIRISREFLVSRTVLISRQQSGIAEISTLSGGWTSYLEQPEHADAVYSEILSKINLRYLIGYYPTNPERDEKRRTVNIVLPMHPEYKIFGRKSYILAPKN